MDAELLAKFPGVVGLVEFVVSSGFQADREGIIGHQAGGDIAGIDAAGEERPDLHIADAVGLDALVHAVVQLVDLLLVRLFAAESASQ